MILKDVVTLLAVAGALAIVLRLVRAAGRLALTAAEAAAAGGLADVSARRGDLTGMTERRQAEQSARARRRGAAARTLLWLLFLVLPLLTGWARELYALASPLWLLSAAATPPPTESERLR